MPVASRGNAARMLFYLEVRYADEFGLRLVDEPTDSSSTVLGVLCTLYQWHFEDPVRFYPHRAQRRALRTRRRPESTLIR